MGLKRCTCILLCTCWVCCLQVLVMGGADDTGEGLPYSQRLSNLGPGQTPSWTYEPMQGQQRIEGVGVLLPDGTVFLCSGAEQGRAPLLPLGRTLARGLRMTAPHGMRSLKSRDSSTVCS